MAPVAHGHGVLISHSRTVSPHFRLSSSSSLPSPAPKLQNPSLFLSPFPPRLSSFATTNNITLASSSSSSSAIKVAEIQQTDNLASLVSDSNWLDFATKVSGEWDGYGADFTSEGAPIELPESVVPEAYREWEVRVFDWQTQCPTVASQEDFTLSYRTVKLLPTVGCEADAATVYSSDVRVIGGEENKALGSAYHSSGSYVAIWPVSETDGRRTVEVESCLIDPRNRESRVRVIQLIRIKKGEFKLVNIRVFCEQWYGPFRNGEQLGGCAIRDSGFASTAPFQASEVIGTWQSREAVASFENSQNKIFRELSIGSTQELIRDEHDLIRLPRQLWCSLKPREHGETCVEVGWLLDEGRAISTRSILSDDGELQKLAIGQDTAIVGTTS